MTDGPPAIKTGSVTSRDGTLIGYRQIGDGTEVVLLHGAGQSSANLLALARALMDCFTVYVPDRRGRGMSGPYAEVHGWRTHRRCCAAPCSLYRTRRRPRRNGFRADLRCLVNSFMGSGQGSASS